ncbi:hypothetical protein B0T22DRAFT_522678 [Podospora appendiculata]|uniref:Uncharacterized protein n=1 Tax=Podospora appendiculata TaxID=314037 RepID=A0AAE0WZS3_9PEZI|nr:hypothetical protein B0T22DRAFT_522678 [Podospora appendiculata]
MMMGIPLIKLVVAGLLFAVAQAFPSGGHQCPPFSKGNFTVSQFQLYPENAIWDDRHCVVYFASLFNGSVVVYDPYRDKVTKILEFPAITNVLGQHASGLDYNPDTNLLSVVIDSQNPFLAEGADVTGDNWLIKYDLTRQRELWRTNLTAVTRGLWGGFQDVSVDTRGNSYVIGTYPKSVVKVTPWGQPSVYYPPQTNDTTVHGYTGTAHVGNTMLVVDNNGTPESSATGNSEIFRLDLNKAHGAPVLVPRTPHTPIGEADKIHLPQAYGGTVLLVAEDLRGLTVLRSLDGWHTAEHRGFIPSDFPVFFQKIVPSSIQIGPTKNYLIGQYFPGAFVPGTNSGNRTDFPMFDLTAQIDALLA